MKEPLTCTKCTTRKQKADAERTGKKLGETALCTDKMMIRVTCNIQNLKKKVVPIHAMKAYKRCGGTAPLILNYGTRWRCEERSPQNHFNGMLGRPQSQSGWYGEEKNIWPLPQFEPQTVQSIA